ncbi:MAG: SAM-dependent chlorinase/fluorinase [Chloroflexi bacterium]|nr:SAM-dependent chlorinase/fluorinase [Chloroflexota bacterium]
MHPPIVILTDFGTLDPYVGIMKGVLLQRGFRGPVVDLSHHIPPGDIARAAFVLWQSGDYFPAGTVFLVVVDPGVGTARRGMLLEARGRRFVGPDNGVFSYLLSPQTAAWELANPAYRLPETSTTFHGRDIFAPAAAHAALGAAGHTFGPPILDPVTLPVPRLAFRAADRVEGQILHADHFGNLLTSLGRLRPLGANRWRLEPWLGQDAPRTMTVHGVELPDGQVVPLVRTFAEVPAGQLAALVGSTGLVEVVANRASAAEMTGWRGGEPVALRIAIEESEGEGEDENATAPPAAGSGEPSGNGAAR